MRRRLALTWPLVAAPLAGAAPPWAVAAPSPAVPSPASDDPVRRQRVITFPRDHGAHLGQGIEWWYVTGWLASPAAPGVPTHGFQITFFRRRTGLALDNPSRFAAKHLLLAHAALTDVKLGKHLHSQRLARWSGAPDATLRHRAALHDADVAMGPWNLRRNPSNAANDGQASTWQANVTVGEGAAATSLALTMQRTQPVLLQGDAGFSRKGPEEAQASHYYSEPQLSVQAQLKQGTNALTLSGRAWLDHEWADSLMHPDAVGWDWIGINLNDGSALTAFQLRRKDGSVLWAGGSFRPAVRAGQGAAETAEAGKAARPASSVAAQSFKPQAVRFEPGRRWVSPSTQANYPVTWTITCPAGRFTVRSVLDAQELDARGSTGTVYWEGLAALHDAQDQPVGWGYLEMTGYAGALRL
jgi:predicted secreted hydrolase